MKALGDRIKEYECPTIIDSKGFFIVRVDGKAFSTYTKNFRSKFSVELSDAMSASAEELMREVQGSVLTYTQSDEISLLFTNTMSENAELWMGGNEDKIVSISSSIVTAKFNSLIASVDKLAHFDSRLIIVPEDDIPNYFVWRWKDCVRNAIQRYARTLYSHKQLLGKSISEILQMFKTDGHDYEAAVLPEHAYGTVHVRTSKVIETDDGDIVNRSVISSYCPEEQSYAVWQTQINQAVELMKK